MSATQLFKVLCRRLGLGFLCCALALSSIAVSAQAAESTNFIVQAENLQAARNAVIKAGGAIANDLKIIKAVNAFLTEEQRSDLEKMPGVKVYADQQAKTSSASMPVRDMFEHTDFAHNDGPAMRSANR